MGLKLLGSRSYGLLYDLIAESKKVKKEEDQVDKSVYNHLRASEWAQQLLRSHGGGVDMLQELQKRGFESLETAASVKAGEHVSNAFIAFSFVKLQDDSRRVLNDKCQRGFPCHR